MAVPVRLPRSCCGQYFVSSRPQPLMGLPMEVCFTSQSRAPDAMVRITSDMANRPIMAGMKSMPPKSSGEPNVKRGSPPGLSIPTWAKNRPRNSEISPFTGEPAPMKMAQASPKSASQKYSNEEKPSATSASMGAARMRMRVPNSPPRAENSTFAPSAVSAWPLRVMA